MLPAFKQYLSTLKLSPVSRKLYSGDVQKYLSFLGSDPTLEQITSSFPKYLSALRAQATAPSMLKRITASLRQFGTFLAHTYNIENPVLLHQPPASRQGGLTINHVKLFTDYLQSDHLSPLTIKSYKSDITRYLDWTNTHIPRTELAQLLSDKNIKKYLNHLLQSDNITSSTIDRKEQSLTRFQSWYTNVYSPAYVTDNNTTIAHPAPEFRTLRERVFGTLPPDVGPEVLPKSAQTFNSRTGVWSLSSIISLAVLLLFIATLAVFAYRQFAKDATLTSAYPSTPVTPNRQLSFQGRLENASGTPITTATNFVFKLFTASSGGTELYSTGTCSITPDSDGVFNTQIGSTCGSAITSSVFTENAGVWLEVTVVAETLAPRQQIATVAYALNSETLQGFPLSATISAIRNTIVPMNQYGEIIVGEQSPRLTGVSGTFQISAPALSIITATGTNGNITLAPDGTGQVNLQGNTTSTNFFNVSNAQLTTGSLLTGTVANANTGFKLIDLLSGSSPTSKFSVTDAGNVTLAGNLTITGGDILDSNGNESIRFGTTASAVNEATLTNAATAGTVLFAATGGDTDIALSIDSKGADALNLNGTATGDVNLAGGYGGTGCTVTNSNGNLSCNGTITGTFAGTLPWSSLVAPTANLSLAHAGYTTAFTFDSVTTADAFALSSSSLTTGTVLDLSSTSTAGGVSGLSKVLDITRSGINANASHTAYGLYSAVTNTGTTSTNVGGYFSASGATNNYGLIVANGNVGIGTTGPGARLHIVVPGSYSTNIPIIETGHGGDAGIIFRTPYSGTNYDGAIYSDYSNTGTMTFVSPRDEAGNGFKFNSNGGTTRMYISTLNGNVGIGTTGPGSLLDVAGGVRLGSAVTHAVSIGLAPPTVDTVYQFFVGTGTFSGQDNVGGEMDFGVNSYYNSGAKYRVSDYASRVGFNSTSDGNISFYTAPSGIAGNAITWSEKVRITNAGNVGIGTTAPGVTLDVVGGGGSYGAYNTPLRVKGTSYSYAEILGTSNQAGIVYNRDGSTGWLTGLNAAGSFRIADLATINETGLTNAKDGSEGITIKTDGNVGIGTTSPGTKLDVAGDTGVGIRMLTAVASLPTYGNDDKALFVYSDPVDQDYARFLDIVTSGGDRGSSIRFMTALANAAPTTKMVINNLGNVGIGTTGPTDKLQIDGGNLVVNGDSTSGGFIAFTNGNKYAQVGASRRLSYDELLTSSNLRGQAGDNNYYTISTHASAGYSGAEYKYGGDIYFYAQDGATTANAQVTPTNRMVILGSTGNVGIGTTSPAVKLHIVGGDMLIRSAGGNNKFYVSGGTSDGANGELYLYDGTQAWPVKLSSSGVSYLNGGNVGIGTTGPSALLTLNQGTADGEILNLKSSDVAHGMTTLTETDTFGKMVKTVAGSGGLTLQGFMATGYSSLALNLGGFLVDTADVTKTTGSQGVIQLQTGIKSGTTNAAIGTNGNLVSIRNSGTTRFLFDAEGTMHSIGASGTDTYGGDGAIIMSGNVGIGTTGPGAKLDVVDGNIRSYTTSTTDPSRVLATSNTSVKAQLGSFPSSFSVTSLRNYSLISGSGPLAVMSDEALSTGGTNPIVFATGGYELSTQERMRITSTGNVGIGTTGPVEPLHVNIAGTGHNFIQITNGDTGAASTDGVSIGVDSDESFTINQRENNYMALYTNNSERMRILAGGNVGIGTTGPVAKLQVSGNAIIGAGANDSTQAGSSRLVISDATGTNTRGLGFFAADGTKNPRAWIQQITAADLSSQYVSFNSDYSSGSTYANWNFMNGNVGIGTTEPLAKLDIRGSVVIPSGLGNAASRPTVGSTPIPGEIFGVGGITPALVWNDGFLRISAGGGSTAGYKSFIDISGFSTVADMNANITFGTMGAEKVRIDSQGNVGIGTTSPGAPLEVVKSSAGNIANFLGTSGENYMYLGSAKATAQSMGIGFEDVGDYGWISIYGDDPTAGTGLIIQKSGNVGIGTTSPLAKLHVVGSCVTGDTLLPIRRRRRRKSDGLELEEDDDPLWDYLLCRIDEILPGDEVLSLNEFTGAMEYSRINALKDMDIREVYELTTKSGRVIRTTENHPYLTLSENNPIDNMEKINI